MKTILGLSSRRATSEIGEIPRVHWWQGKGHYIAEAAILVLIFLIAFYVPG